MAFKNLTNTTTKSWMDDSPAQTPVSIPVAPKTEAPQIDTERVWMYPQLKNTFIPKLEHKLPHRLEKAINRYYDFQNWFETIWMVLVLNNRWTMTEVFVPEHMVKILGGSKLQFHEEKGQNTIVWKITN